MNAIKIISTIIGAAVPILYVFGQAYYRGWFAYWGMPQEFFPIELEELLMHGYITLTVLALPNLLLLFMYFLIAVGTLYNVNELAKFAWVKKLAGLFKNEAKNDGSTEDTSLVLALGNTIKATFVVVFVFLFLLIILFTFEKVSNLGKENAQNKHQELIDKVKKASIKAGDKYILGQIITCSNQFCGVLVNKKKIIIIPVTGDFEVQWDIEEKPNQTKPIGKSTETNRVRLD